MNYVRQDVCKPIGVITKTYAGRLQEISNYLEYFPGPYPNVPLMEGDLIDKPFLVAKIHEDTLEKLLERLL